MALQLNKTRLNSLHPRKLWANWASLVEICQVALEKKILNDFNVSLLYLPLEKDMALHLNKPEFHSPNDALFQVWLKLAKCFWRSSFLKCHFFFFC